MNGDELIENAEWLASSGVGMTEAAERLNYKNRHTLRTALIRRNQIDLLNRLVAQDYVPGRPLVRKSS